MMFSETGTRIRTEAQTMLSDKFPVSNFIGQLKILRLADIYLRNNKITRDTTVRTTRPEKCDIFSQRYQSEPITKTFQKHC